MPGFPRVTKCKNLRLCVYIYITPLGPWPHMHVSLISDSTLRKCPSMWSIWRSGNSGVVFIRWCGWQPQKIVWHLILKNLWICVFSLGRVSVINSPANHPSIIMTSKGKNISTKGFFLRHHPVEEHQESHDGQRCQSKYSSLSTLCGRWEWVGRAAVTEVMSLLSCIQLQFVVVDVENGLCKWTKFGPSSM